MTIDRRKFRLAPYDPTTGRGCYYPGPVKKSLIVLHFTAGSTASGAASEFARRRDGVATAYILDRDGTVYELFPPEAWAYHLGKGNTTRNNQRSIAIEIVNVGPLVQRGDDLCWWPPADKKTGQATFQQRWCTSADHDRYIMTTPWRGFSRFAKFTELQYESLKPLVDELCHRFGIPRVIPPADKRMEYAPATFVDWTGIASHQNYRKDKSDVGPAFEWSRI